MAGPKKREKLTKPGLDYKIQKALTDFQNLSEKVNAKGKAILKTLTQPAKSGKKELVAKYDAEAKNRIKNRLKRLKKTRFESIQKQKKKN